LGFHISLHDKNSSLPQKTVRHETDAKRCITIEAGSFIESLTEVSSTAALSLQHLSFEAILPFSKQEVGFCSRVAKEAWRLFLEIILSKNSLKAEGRLVFFPCIALRS
jgi:hypothetical protein